MECIKFSDVVILFCGSFPPPILSAWGKHSPGMSLVGNTWWYDLYIGFNSAWVDCCSEQEEEWRI